MFNRKSDVIMDTIMSEALQPFLISIDDLIFLLWVFLPAKSVLAKTFWAWWLYVSPYRR